MIEDGRLGELADDKEGYCTQLCCKEALPCATCLCEARPGAGAESGRRARTSGHIRIEEGI